MHSRSATRPQVFHKHAGRRRCAGWLVAACVAGSVGLSAYAQVPTPAPVHRVFLTNGVALPSYGEAAVVADRVVFNLSIGGTGGPGELQLISLPATMVDVERTTRYAESLRAEFYAARHGEAAFASMTAALSRDLQALTAVADPRRQLLLAEQLRQRLRGWPSVHFYYRVEDVDRLVGLVDDVINELKASIGERAFSLELAAGPRAPRREPLLQAPGLRESIELALAAASFADVAEDRLGILRAASRVVPAGDAGVKATVASRLTQEIEASRSYQALGAEIRAGVRNAEARGDEADLDRLEAELFRRDRQLGFRRPQEVQGLLEELGVARVAARARREALARYAAMRRELLAYERAVRPALSGLDGLRLVLEHLRDMRAVDFDRVLRSEERLARLQAGLARVAPPADVHGVHATLGGALNLAREACARRRQAAVTNQTQTRREASSAAAGALLLADRARRDLVDALCLGGQVATCDASR